MSTVEEVRNALQRWPQPYKVGEYVTVPTFVIYPSGALVQVYVAFGQSTVQISDGGGAYDEIIRRGDYGFDPMRMLRSVARRLGLSADDRGWIVSRQVSWKELATYVALVANASRDAAEQLVRRFKPYEKTDYRRNLDVLLRSLYHNQLKKEIKVQGRDKIHRFDYGISSMEGGILLLDAVVPDANSVNSAVVSHLDVQRAELEGHVQRIVYHKGDGWKSSDISLLNVGAKTIEFSALPTYLGREIQHVDVDQHKQRLLDS